MEPYGMHPRILKEIADVITKLLLMIFDQSLESRELPADQNLVNVVLSFKKDKEDPRNYRPVSLTSVPDKVVEKVILVVKLSMRSLTISSMSSTQHKRFRQWVSNQLMNQAQSEWDNNRLVTCHKWVPQGSILGLVLFNIFISDLDAGLEGILSKFAEETKLGGVVDSLEGRKFLHRDFNKIEGWAITNHRKFNKRKCQILHLGWDNPGCMYRLGNESLESSATERDLGVLVNVKLNMNQQCPGSQEGNHVLGGIRQSITSRSKEGIVLLSASALEQLHLEYYVQFWVPQYRKVIKLLKRVQRRATKMVEGLEWKLCEEWMKALELFSLENRRLKGNLIAVTTSS
ncbi:RNA-directed DNA polymerase from mobile element jockey-like protein [Willisornis vidua]|uniref:RNA-directed DNA polymerase from mobile element jockey-like protein n=1 Tax=Willisornis vidua TaxID=1566151 RepID=A0ABQ9D4P0_9PASS|nr:RNA-directed DNA polymerase from mobile element jockey-like protein [Willisornis vidua]